MSKEIEAMEDICEENRGNIFEKQKERQTARNELETYCFNVKNTLDDEKVKDKISEDDMKTITDECDEAIKWLDANQLAEIKEMSDKQKEVEGVCNPIITKLYADAGAMPDMGGMEGGGNKDGNVLLHEMQVQHPTASLIAIASTAHDDIREDGTTSNFLLIGEFLKQAHQYIITENLHPRIVTDGFDMAKAKALEVLDSMKISITGDEKQSILTNISATSLGIKVHPNLAAQLTPLIMDAVQAVQIDSAPIDLHMVELMEIQHRSEMEIQLVKGLVLDHGGGHPDMPKRLENCYILTCKVSLEYEKTKVNRGFCYKSSEDREKLVTAERKFINDRVHMIIELKKKLCTKENGKTFVVINQKGVDPFSLDAFAKEGMMALGRANRRNMERLVLAVGGFAMNSVEELTEDCLGQAGLVYEHVWGDNKFTVVEQCANPKSVTILMTGPNKQTLQQTKDAVRDGLIAVKYALEDGCVIPGAGAYEIATYVALKKFLKTVNGRARLGIQAYADGLLILPKVLAQNAGYDAQDVIVKLLEESAVNPTVGVDCDSGEIIVPQDKGIYDNYRYNIIVMLLIF